MAVLAPMASASVAVTKSAAHGAVAVPPALPRILVNRSYVHPGLPARHPNATLLSRRSEISPMEAQHWQAAGNRPRAVTRERCGQPIGVYDSTVRRGSSALNFVIIG
jgi:hypothetical protein